MEHGEIIQRVVGVLVEAGEYRRGLIANPDREDESDDASDVIGGLVGDILRLELDIPDDVSVQDIGLMVSKELGPRVYELLGGFALAFLELADVHDQGGADVSSADVLRRLALKAEGL